MFPLLILCGITTARNKHIMKCNLLNDYDKQPNSDALPCYLANTEISQVFYIFQFSLVQPDAGFKIQLIWGPGRCA